MFTRHQSFGGFAGRRGGARAPASTGLAVVVAFVLLAGLAASGVGARPAGASTEGRSIRISKYLCPDDLSYASAAQLDLADLYEPCGELGPGVTFQLSTNSGDTQVAQTALNYFDFYLAIADFDNLEERTYTVQEVIPAGYTTPVVFCAVFYEGGNGFSWEPVDVSDDGAFTLSMVDVNDVLCEWFNIVSTASDFAGGVRLRRRPPAALPSPTVRRRTAVRLRSTTSPTTRRRRAMTPRSSSSPTGRPVRPRPPRGASCPAIATDPVGHVDTARPAHDP